MPDISHALTDDFIMTVHSDNIYKETSVCEQTVRKTIDQTQRFQASHQSVSHVILLGMQCSKPRMVPVPLSKDGEGKADFAIWASMSEKNGTLNMVIKTIDNAPITIRYDDQQAAPEVYKNELLSNSCLLWKGNVILGKEGGTWRLDLLKEFSWLKEVQAALLAEST